MPWATVERSGQRFFRTSSEEQQMVWRVTTIRDGTEIHDAIPYITKDDALRVVKSALEKGAADSAYLFDPYGNRQEWSVVKKALDLP